MREPTDDEIERARPALVFTVTGIDRNGNQYTETHELHPDQVRKALRAALNPPPVPEIEVTGTMCRVGIAAYREWVRTRPNNSYFADVPMSYAGMELAYRAMHAARSKEIPQNYTAHRRSTDTACVETFHYRETNRRNNAITVMGREMRTHVRGTDPITGQIYTHRRQDDPQWSRSTPPLRF